MHTHLTLFALLATSASAQWDPGNGQWGKTDPTDLRVMTWNVEDGICSTNAKTDSFANWNGLVRIVAAMKPDVIILQVTGDNSGNGTGNGVDTVPNLTTTFDLFLHGGNDPFEGGTVTSYAQLFDPAFDLPFIFVTTREDNFNRNVILSRYPFKDLNGDTREVYDDIPFIGPSGECAPGGNGGIRGIQIVEIDLPDEIYAGDLVVMNGHLKAGGSQSDKTQRMRAAQNAGYFINFALNGAGTGLVDPEDNIFESPPITSLLDGFTPLVVGGDLNEDEDRNGQRGPAEWLATGCVTGGSDGNDRDQTDMVFDDATEPFTGTRTTRGSSKLDYLIRQDSIAGKRRAFIFNSSPANANGGIPPELETFPGNPALASTIASDHLPVVMDMMLELIGGCPADLDGDGDADADDFFAYLDAFAIDDLGVCDIDGDGDCDADDFFAYLDFFAQGC